MIDRSNIYIYILYIYIYIYTSITYLCAETKFRRLFDGTIVAPARADRVRLTAATTCASRVMPVFMIDHAATGATRARTFCLPTGVDACVGCDGVANSGKTVDR